MKNVEALEQKLQNFKGFLIQDPNNIKLLRDVAQLQADLGYNKDALENYQHLSALSGLSGDRFRQAECLMRLSQYQNALHILEDIDTDDIALINVIKFNEAYCRTVLGAFVEADAILQTILNEHEIPFPEILLLNARIKHYLGNVDEAKNAIKRYLELVSDDAHGLGVAALIFLDDEKNKEALAYAEKALLLFPEQKESLLVKGMVFLGDFELEKATSFFEKVLSIDESSGRALLGLGLVAMLEKSMEKSESYISRALQFMPEHVGSWVTLAWVQIVQQEWQRVEQSIDEAMRLDRNFSESHGTRAVLLIAKGEFEEAEREKNLALRLNPVSFAGLYAQSMLLNLAGKEDEAESIINTTLSAPFLEGGLSLNDMIAKVANAGQKTLIDK